MSAQRASNRILSPFGQRAKSDSGVTRTVKITRRISLLLALATVLALNLLPASASAAVPHGWQLVAISNSTASPTGEVSATTRIQGAPGHDEVQILRIGAISGQFKLSYGTETTGDLAFDAGAGALQAALEGLPGIGAGSVQVAGGPGAVPYGEAFRGVPYEVTFQEALAEQDLSQIEVEPGSTPLGGFLTYKIEAINRTEEPSSAGPEVTLSLPSGLSGASSSGFDCGNPAGLSVISCSGPAVESNLRAKLTVTVAVDPGAAGNKTAHIEVSGGGLAADTTVVPARISPTPESFGIHTFDLQLGEPAAPYTQAAGHPEVQTTAFDFNTATDTSPTSSFLAPVVGSDQPIEPVKDIVVDLPPGLVGSPGALTQCESGQLANSEGLYPRPLCDASSQVGTAEVRNNGFGLIGTLLGPYPIFNMAPPPGVPARFGINVLGTVVTLDASVRSGSDYGLRIASRNTSAGVTVIGSKLDFWGVPADPAHEFERSCPGLKGPVDANSGPEEPCPSAAPPAAFLRTPTSCTDSGLEAGIHVSSWFHPADFDSRSIRTHEGPGYPSLPEEFGPEVGIDGCGEVPFEPTMDAKLTTNSADSPTGLSVDLGLPDDCWDAKSTASEAEEAICQSDFKEARVTLPQGLSLNPSAAAGLGSCSAQQVGLSTPIGSSPVHFDEAPVSCPDSSKIGSVEIATPQLALHGKDGAPVLDGQGNPVLEPLKGSIYLAQQSQNPFGSLLALYLVAEGSGVRVKQAGHIELSDSGRLTTTFDSIPQSPVSSIHFELFGGPRAALRTPPTCGTYTANATLTPWSGNAAVDASSSFGVTQGCGGAFNPKLEAGTQNPLAGTYSPFHIRLSRDDGTSELAGLSLKLPRGLLANLGSVAYCPEATLAAISPALGTGAVQIATPSCPAASAIGTVTVGAGAGPNPFYTSSGRVYWAGPYKGAPISIAAVVPAVAGPFDLGTVVVRNALRVDPDTAEITAISDPLPSILSGIPLDLRDIRIDIDRPNYTLNPTSCEPKSVDATLTSTTGATAARSTLFQAAGCDRLGFKPKLALALKGPVHRRAHPSLTATYTTRSGDANLARAQVKLPPAAFLDNAHIGTICTRVQFAAQACPAASVYGHASATSPILGYPVEGNVYLRSSSHLLPDLVADLRGPSSQPIEVALAGKTDAVKGALRNTFEVVPDAPVTKFSLTLFGKGKGLIQMSSGFCAHPKASVKLDAQNGRGLDSSPVVKAKCGKSGNATATKRHRSNRTG